MQSLLYPASDVIRSGPSRSAVLLLNTYRRRIQSTLFFFPSCFHLSRLTSYAPLLFHALMIKPTILSTPFPFLTSANIVGPPSLRDPYQHYHFYTAASPPYLMRPASLSITFKSAPTASARSIYTKPISTIPSIPSTSPLPIPHPGPPPTNPHTHIPYSQPTNPPP